eukprot:scpid36894/ scgid3479/ Meiosis-specific serine/threonine-protein kinase mek1
MFTQEVRFIMFQLNCAMVHLHTERILHRDIRLENVLMHSTPNQPWRIKLSDFGLSVMMREEKNRQYRDAFGPSCGDLRYTNTRSRREYRWVHGDINCCDVWHMGVIMYRLITGDVNADVREKLDHSGIDLWEPCWKEVNFEATDYLCKLLKPNGDERTSSTKAFKHSWLKEKPPPEARIQNLLEAQSSRLSAMSTKKEDVLITILTKTGGKKKVDFKSFRSSQVSRDWVC